MIKKYSIDMLAENFKIENIGRLRRKRVVTL
jgi:hypothetical protein